jgi:hypothetical protein
MATGEKAFQLGWIEERDPGGSALKFID